MTNVIAFPKGKKHSPVQSVSDVIRHVEEVRKEQIELMADGLIHNIVQSIYDDGYDVSSPQCIVPIAYLTETIKGILCASMNIDHPIHQHAVDFYETKIEED